MLLREQIRQSLLENLAVAESTPDLARRAGIPLRYIYVCASEAGISIRDFRKQATKRTISKAILEGATTTKEIVEKTGFSPSTIIKYVKKSTIEIAKLNKKIKRIEQALANGLTTRRQVVTYTEIPYNQVCSIMRIQGIQLSDQRGTHNRKINETRAIRLIKRGLSLQQIANKSNVGRERIRQYINSRGLHAQWQQSRYFYTEVEKIEKIKKAVKTGAKTLKEIAKKTDLATSTISTYLQQYKERIQSSKKGKSLANLISAVQQNSYRKASWAEQKAFDFTRSVPRTAYSFEQLTKLFQTYKNAKDNKEALSLDELSKEAGLLPACISTILRTSRLESMIRPGNKSRLSASTEKKEALNRTYYLEMSNTDIAYFLGLSKENVEQFYKKFATEQGINRRPVVHAVPLSPSNKKLTNRLASQIYEAQDADFSLEEIVELLETDLEVISYITHNRKIIGSKIIHALQVLYPNQHVTKPYKTFKD